MRLKNEVKDKIINYAKIHFGKDCKIYLFGSRVYDDKKGGDIDLLLECNRSVSMKERMFFLKDIYKNVTQRKIDLIIKTPSKNESPVYKTAIREGILLC